MAAPPNNRRITIILVVGGVFVALLAAVNLMGGGGGGEPGEDSTITPAATAAGGSEALATPPTTAPAPAPSLPNDQFDAFATRNPFEPAIQVTDDVDPGAAPIDPGTDPGTATPPDTAPPRSSSPDPSAGTVVALVDVFDEGGITMARIQVGSTVFTVAAGQTFATSYKVVSLSGTCGQFLYGDSPFTLCENEQVIK
jgi:hypothetical protein